MKYRILQEAPGFYTVKRLYELTGGPTYVTVARGLTYDDVLLRFPEAKNEF